MNNNNFGKTILFMILFVADIVVTILSAASTPENFKFLMLFENTDETVKIIFLFFLHIVIFIVLIVLVMSDFRNIKCYGLANDDFIPIILKIIMVLIDVIVTLIAIRIMFSFIICISIFTLIIYCIANN